MRLPGLLQVLLDRDEWLVHCHFPFSTQIAPGPFGLSSLAEPGLWTYLPNEKTAALRRAGDCVMSDSKFDDHLFSNNPFRDNLRTLKKSGLAQQGTSGRDSMVRVREQRRRKKHGDPAFEEECDIFLQAMEGMTGDRVDHKDKAEEDDLFLSQMSQGLAGSKKGAAKDGTRGGRSGARSEARSETVSKAGSNSPAKARAATEKKVSQATTGPAGGQEHAQGKQPASRDAQGQDMSMEELLQQGMQADEFAKAMAGVTPLTKAGRDVAPRAKAKPFAGAPGNALQDFMDGKLEFALSFTDEYMEGFVVGLDPVMMQKLRQGSFSPEAHIDLHGLNTQQAFETLRGFFKGSWYRGLRCVIVVCGRGKNSPDGIGILREKLQLWFTQEPFKRVILAFCTAKAHDGGAGAVYVLMRKFKKKGRIAWERMPADEDLF